MSWFPWLTKSGKQLAEERKQRQDHARQGTVISGEFSGQKLGDILGLPNPSVGPAHTAGTLLDAIANTPINPVGSFIVPVPQHTQQEQLSPPVDTTPVPLAPTPTDATEGLNVGVTPPKPPTQPAPPQTDKFIQAAREATSQLPPSDAVDYTPLLSLVRSERANQSYPPTTEGGEHDQTQSSGGVQTKQGYQVGGDQPMLAWLAGMAPGMLEAVLAGAAGTLGASAAKKIVGDAPGSTTPEGLKTRLFGLSQEEMQAVQSAYSRAREAGSPGTFPEILNTLAPTTAVNQRGTVPSPDQGQVQMVADGALLMANGVSVPTRAPIDTASLGLAALMRGSGQQPKLYHNQDNAISAPNTQQPAVTAAPSNPQPNPTSLGSQLAALAGMTGQTVAHAAKEATIQAAGDFGRAAAGAAVPAITKLAGVATDRLSGWLTSGIASAVNMLTKKIVGDDPMPQTTGRARKVVGDAPSPQSDEEHNNAALALSSSISVQYAAARLVMEQMLGTMVPIPPLGNKEEIGQAIVSASHPDLTLYNNEPIDVETERIGMTMWPSIVPYFDTDIRAWRYVLMSTITSRVIQVQQEKSVPIVETPLAASIAPMLVGAPITEYSGALRIKTMRTDFDILMTILGRAIPDLLTDGGYSNARPLAVLLCLAAAWGGMPGTEASNLVSGVAMRQTREFPVALGQSFPLSGAVNWDGALAWVTLGEYARALNGEIEIQGQGAAAAWDPRFTPDKWDVSCAVIPIYREEMADGEGNAVRILANCEHPFVTAAYNIEWRKLQDNGYQVIDWYAQGQPSPLLFTAYPNTMLSLIEGPKDAVLFVVVDMPQRRPCRLRIGSPQLQVILNENITPANPIVRVQGADHVMVGVIQAFMNSNQLPHALTAQIQRLEQQIVTASDRSSAMRLVGDLHVRFSKPPIYTRTEPGRNDEMSGYYAAFDDRTGLPVMYRVPANADNIRCLQYHNHTPSLRYLHPDPEGGSGTPNLPPTHRVGRYSSMLHILAMRGMITWQEEKAQVPLGPIFPLVEAIYESAVMTAACADVVSCTDGYTVADYYENTNVEQHGENTLRSLHWRNRMAPQLQRMFMAGIQFPATVPTYEDQDFPLTYQVYTWTYAESARYGPMVRVPWLGLHRYFGGLVPASPVINLSALQGTRPPQYSQVRVTTGPQQRETYKNSFEAYPGQDGVIAEMAKFSLSAVPDTMKINPAIYVSDSNTTTNIALQGFAVTPPDASWSRAFAYSIYNAGVVDQRTECTSLPIGSPLPMFNIRTGRRRRYYITGHSPIFRMPAGSAAIRIITSADTPAGLVDADLFPNDYPWLYQSGGEVVFY